MEYKIDLDMHSYGSRTELEFGTLEISGDVTHGFRPFQLMTSSVAGCYGGGLRRILKKQRMNVTNIRIQSKVVRVDGDVNRIEKIHIHFVITGKGLNQSLPLYHEGDG
jgi:CRISPR-associated DxTHG motif protein